MDAIDVNEYIELLGRRARDKVTRFTGTVATISFDLYGCVQVVLSPEIDKDGKLPEGHWFDAKRIELIGTDRALPLPTFESVPGPAEKPTLDIARR